MEMGLCCLFRNEPIAYKSYSFAHLKRLADQSGLSAVTEKVLSVWENNVKMLQLSFDYCTAKGIRGFRISSDLFPQSGRLRQEGLITQEEYNRFLEKLRELQSGNLILSMHPGQHVNLGSPSESVVANSIDDLREHFDIAEQLNIGEINIHLGGSYGDKGAAIDRFCRNISTIPDKERNRITLENDELNYSLPEVVATAQKLGLRVVYDIHHQRCHELKYEGSGTSWDYYELAGTTWRDDDVQRLHISSPRDGFTTITKSRPHHDFIQPEDIPEWLWKENCLVDIEAKAKEVAVAAVQKELEKRRQGFNG